MIEHKGIFIHPSNDDTSEILEFNKEGKLHLVSIDKGSAAPNLEEDAEECYDFQNFKRNQIFLSDTLGTLRIEWLILGFYCL